MPGSSAVGSVVRGGVQVRTLGIQPCGRLPEGGHVGSLGRWVARWQATGRRRPGEAPTCGQGGVQVIVQQTADCDVRFRRVVGGGEGAGVFAEQVV
jgi:hypothetical protein